MVRCWWGKRSAILSLQFTFLLMPSPWALTFTNIPWPFIYSLRGGRKSVNFWNYLILSPRSHKALVKQFPGEQSFAMKNSVELISNGYFSPHPPQEGFPLVFTERTWWDPCRKTDEIVGTPREDCFNSQARPHLSSGSLPVPTSYWFSGFWSALTKFSWNIMCLPIFSDFGVAVSPVTPVLWRV